MSPLSHNYTVRIQHRENGFATNAIGSLSGKEKAITRNKKIMNGKAHRQSKYKVKVGNHLHTNMMSKQGIVRRAQMQDIGNAFEIKPKT